MTEVGRCWWSVFDRLKSVFVLWELDRSKCVLSSEFVEISEGFHGFFDFQKTITFLPEYVEKVLKKSVMVFVFAFPRCEYLSVHGNPDSPVTEAFVLRKSGFLFVERVARHRIEFHRC